MSKRNRFVCGLMLCFAVVAIFAIQYIGKTTPTVASLHFTPKIVIDPGHGGMDGGAVGVGQVVEKHINLEISKDLRDFFMLNGIDVVMTREEDISIHDQGLTRVKQQKTSDMHNRLKIMEQNPDCIFLSIHQNKFEQSRYSGTQIFYSKNLPSSEQLAATIQKQFVSFLQPENTRQHKPAGKELFLLHNAQVPAVLIECGFLSNPEECTLLSTEEYQTKVAFTVFCSVLEFMNQESI